MSQTRALINPYLDEQPNSDKPVTSKWRNAREKFCHQQQAMADEIANKLYRESRQLFINIPPEELFKNKSEQIHLNAAIHRTNMLGQLIENDILSHQRLDERTMVMERWIMVMSKAYKMQDMETVYIIDQALHDYPIFNLTTWEKNPKNPDIKADRIPVGGIAAGLSDNAAHILNRIHLLFNDATTRPTPQGGIPILMDFLPMALKVSEFSSDKEAGQTKVQAMMKLHQASLEKSISNSSVYQKEKNIFIDMDNSHLQPLIEENKKRYLTLREEFKNHIKNEDKIQTDKVKTISFNLWQGEMSYTEIPDAKGKHSISEKKMESSSYLIQSSLYAHSSSMVNNTASTAESLQKNASAEKPTSRPKITERPDYSPPEVTTARSSVKATPLKTDDTLSEPPVLERIRYKK